MTKRKTWTASHTALMAWYRGKGWTNAQIARKLGFKPKTVQRHSACWGLPTCYEARKQPRIPLDFLSPNFPMD